MGNNNHSSGVNLGGWLVSERWITPSLFVGTDAQDELSFISCYPGVAKERLGNHWQCFITADDFLWLRDQGVDIIRIPVGYWLFGDFPPFLENIKWLDFAFEQANKQNIRVLIDLHGAPGSQNGWDHSGKHGETHWHKDPQNIHLTLDVLERLAKRYASCPNLWGIELLNEPSSQISLSLLKNFYKEGYMRIRKYCDEKVSVVIHDSFRPFSWFLFMKDKKYKNVVLDTHLYQCFTQVDKLLNIEGHVWKTNALIKAQLAFMQKSFPLIIGEWSAGLDPKSIKGTSREDAEKRYIKVQHNVFSSTLADFFWTYKTEDMEGWSFRSCIENGWLQIALH